MTLPFSATAAHRSARPSAWMGPILAWSAILSRSVLLGGVLVLGALGDLRPALAQVDWEQVQRDFDGVSAIPAASVRRIVIDLSDRRLTLYEGEQVVTTYPVAVGRSGWRTPTGEFEVTQMVRDPAWMNPFTQEVIGGGNPRNPLGRFWIGFWTDGDNWVGMHGTPNPESVGTEASHGCVRLYNEDIQSLFSQVSMGTPVAVVP